MSTLAKLWPACTSALQLDRMRMGEAVPPELREHVASCPRCSAALQELAQAEELPPMRVVALPQQKRAWPRVVAGLSVAAAASVLLVMQPLAGTRLKGSAPLLAMYVQHAGEVRRAEPDAVLAPGDAVRFAVTTPASAYVAVLSLDPRGRASIYAPFTAVAAGLDLPLPAATQLDASLGEERIVGLFCEKALDLEPVRAALESGRFAVPAGCQVTRWSFVKR